MCDTCGCDGDGATVRGVGAAAHTHTHVRPDGTIVTHAHGDDGDEHAHGHAHDHAHAHDRDHDHDHSHDHAHAEPHAHGDDHGHAHDHAHAHAPDHGPLIALQAKVLGKNSDRAAANRRELARRGVTAINVMSSPGAGKTTLLTRTLPALRGGPVAVIEGDQATTLDADRIAATGAAVVQVNTGKGCHLEAEMVWAGVEQLAPAPGALLVIENVGNLVCPALFDLGEALRVVLLSVAEGDDKPAKYPHMFAVADVVVLTKLDLLPHVDFDVARARAAIERLSPGARFFELSARTGDGMPAWLAWLDGLRTARPAAGAPSATPPDPTAAGGACSPS